LNRKLAESGAVPTSNIPLLADTSRGDIREAVLTHTIGDVEAGSRLGEAFSDGPVENATMLPPTFAIGTTHGGVGGWWQIWTRGTLQDYRDFGPIHGTMGASLCNVLMADGSVRTFQDLNGDTYLNNGFDPDLYTGVGSIGYTAKNVELPPEDVHSGHTLQRSLKGNLDTM
jgi:prepilin-type processing-associated H-X9-DG protein